MCQNCWIPTTDGFILRTTNCVGLLFGPTFSKKPETSWNNGDSPKLKDTQSRMTFESLALMTYCTILQNLIWTQTNLPCFPAGQRLCEQAMYSMIFHDIPIKNLRYSMRYLIMETTWIHIPISKDSAGNIMNGNTSNNRRFIAKSYPLVNVYHSYWKWWFSSWIYPLKME